MTSYTELNHKLTILFVNFWNIKWAIYSILTCLNYIFKWEDTMKSITQVYLQQIRLKNTNNYKKQAKQLHAYYYQWKKYIQSITIYK